ncbi:protein snakeskin-like [Palaemon carinicauda]|uniref:protein snakeskin-like n=1 Tax=Palaemon carinicauda TaxID=392227 RepID=UPI0035B57AFC
MAIDSPASCCSKCNCRFQFKVKPTAVLKIFQMVSVSVTFGIFRDTPLTFSADYRRIVTDADVFCGGVMVAQLIVTPVLFVCHHINRVTIEDSLVEPVLHIIFCVFSLISGFIGLSFWNDPSDDWESEKSSGIAMVVFCFITSILYFLDIFVFMRVRCAKPSGPSGVQQIIVR